MNISRGNYRGWSIEWSSAFRDGYTGVVVDQTEWEVVAIESDYDEEYKLPLAQCRKIRPALVEYITLKLRSWEAECEAECVNKEHKKTERANDEDANKENINISDTSDTDCDIKRIRLTRSIEEVRCITDTDQIMMMQREIMLQNLTQVLQQHYFDRGEGNVCPEDTDDVDYVDIGATGIAGRNRVASCSGDSHIPRNATDRGRGGGGWSLRQGSGGNINSESANADRGVVRSGGSSNRMVNCLSDCGEAAKSSRDERKEEEKGDEKGEEKDQRSDNEEQEDEEEEVNEEGDEEDESNEDESAIDDSQSGSEEESEEESEDEDSDESSDSSDGSDDSDESEEETIDLKVTICRSDDVRGRADDVRGFSVPISSGFMTITKELKEYYGSNPKLCYKDDDGDNVLILATSDFQYAVRAHNSKNAKEKTVCKLRLSADFTDFGVFGIETDKTSQDLIGRLDEIIALTPGKRIKEHSSPNKRISPKNHHSHQNHIGSLRKHSDAGSVVVERVFVCVDASGESDGLNGVSGVSGVSDVDLTLAMPEERRVESSEVLWQRGDLLGEEHQIFISQG